MTLAHPHLRQSLHLNIDASPYDLQGIPSGSNTPSSSIRASIGTEITSPAGSSMSELIICSVLCMYDFQSDDPDHLEFRKNEILDVVKQEDTGWWAAMRRGGDFIGWIPEAFVNRLTEEMTERLWNVREELRVYEYDAEQLYNAAPTVRNNEWYDTSPDPSPIASPALGNGSSVRSVQPGLPNLAHYFAEISFVAGWSAISSSVSNYANATAATAQCSCVQQTNSAYSRTRWSGIPHG